MTSTLRSLLICTAPFLFASTTLPQGKVYLVLGSDTATWDGMDVSRYHCTYALSLYTDPAQNAARVMEPAFRSGLTDSYGTPVKFTWWMMAGNIFRYATNTNIPHPNTMTMYLMRRYHGSAISTWGDELSLHYHTFAWTDYDQDGKWYWNQALAFPECREDFGATLSELLLEEGVFPVSFRSGWHYMDNAWQHTLDSLLLYSMHNDWPAVRRDTTEPLDNTYDWSRSPKTFVPFHPSTTDYRVPGDGPGWNLRSVYMASVDSAFMEGVFAAAKLGTDQVVCLWAHLPETDFLDNVRRVNTAAHKVAPRYPAVPFRYCTAVEAMQAWRTTRDTTSPVLTIQEVGDATVRWIITSTEPLFQPLPFVALKLRDGRYQTLPCTRLSPTSWQTADPLPRQEIAKIGVAGTDSAGNLGRTFLRYVPDDMFVEDGDPGYRELKGIWGSSATSTWGRTSRVATLGPLDTAAVRWTPSLSGTALYNIFVQSPTPSSPAKDLLFRVLEHGVPVDSIRFPEGITTPGWTYLTTRRLSDTTEHALELWAHGSGQGSTVVAADVVKYSALVRQRWLAAPEEVSFGEVIARDTVYARVILQNRGTETLTVSGTPPGGEILLHTPLPVQIPPMSSKDLQFSACFSSTGTVEDSLRLSSDDPLYATVCIPIRAVVRNFFRVVDDRDSLAYHETGTWSFSVAQAYGTTSRYIYPTPGASATFAAVLRDAGRYEISAIVPTTVNASTRARYLLTTAGTAIDSLFRDQNSGSGAWVLLFDRMFPAGTAASVVLTDAMSPVEPGKVLRADAIRFAWVSSTATSAASDPDGIPQSTSLTQNYPNPFNPETNIGFQISEFGLVKLQVYDLLGREVSMLVNEEMHPGRYQVRFYASGLPTGVYLCRLTSRGTSDVKKLLFVR